MCFRMLRFFFETDRATIAVELDHTITFRVAHLITENACSALDRERFTEKIKFPVEDVVAQNQARAGVANEFAADQKSLGDALWFRLFCILDLDSELGTVAQEILQHWHIFRRGNDQDIALAAEHEGRERVTDHRFVVNWEQLFAHDLGDRKKSAAGAARKNDGLLWHASVMSSGNVTLHPFNSGAAAILSACPERAQ